MPELVSSGAQLGWVAVKAILLFVTAVIGFRISHRRTLAEMTAFDFVAAVGVGAILGRVPNSSITSYAAGAVTLATILVGHAIVTRVRYWGPMSRMVDHPPRMLVVDGRVIDDELRRAGLTRADLFGRLRQQNVVDLSQVRYAIFEQRGRISIIRYTDASGETQLNLVDDVARKTPSAR